MTRKELIQLLLHETDSYEDYPFNKNKREKTLWTVIKQKNTHKMIALIFAKNGQLMIDLKLKPEHGDEVRIYDGVFPGYHMNKTHWNTVVVNNTNLPYDGLIKMIEESNRLTKR